VLFLNELWNYGFFGLQSTLVGFLGIAVFLAPLTALLLALRKHERFSAGLFAAYWVWVEAKEDDTETDREGSRG